MNDADLVRSSPWIALAVALGVGLIFFGGLRLLLGRAGLSLARREFLAGFLSPVAYVVLVVFLALTGVLFLLTMRLLTASGPQGVEYPMQVMKLWLIFLFLPPVLTMRVFAEERATGTLEMLLTAPVRDWQIVLAKFLAVYAFFLVLLAPTASYLPILLDWQIEGPLVWTPMRITFWSGVAAFALGVPMGVLSTGSGWRTLSWILILGGIVAASVGGVVECSDGSCVLPTRIVAGIDPNPVALSYLGLALAGAMFLSIGLLVSSLVRSQIVAFLISLAVSLLFMLDFVVDLVSSAFGLGASGSALVPSYFSVPVHFTRDMARGVLDTRPLVLYISVTLFCLYLTVRSLESQRWR